MSSRIKRNDSRMRRSRSRSRERKREKEPRESSKHNKVKKRAHSPEKPTDSTSLSIEETNKLRAKLGLAPLEVEPQSQDDGKIKDAQYGDFYHVPAKSTWQQMQTQKLQEKLRIQKEKREALEKLRQVKSIAAEVSTNSTESWIENVKRKKEAKAEAERKARELEQLDQEFGVSDMVKAGSYTDKDLEGLNVLHNLDRFQEGKSMIMTLKDVGVLDEAEDALVNVNIADDEKADKNRDNIRKQKGLGGILAEEDQNYLAGFKAKSVLHKYDEETIGDAIRLGSKGSYMADHEKAMRQLQNELSMGTQSLAVPEARLESDFFTEEEMQAKFKKRKRKVKTMRSRATVEALTAVSEDAQDHGSREKRGKVSSGTKREAEKVVDAETGFEQQVASILAVTSTDASAADVDSDEEWARLRGAEEEPDEFQAELERTLSRVRRAKAAEVKRPEELAAKLLREEAEVKREEPDEDRADQPVVFDYAAEFYKSISTRFKDHNEQRQLKQDAASPDHSDADSISHMDNSQEDVQTRDSDSEGELNEFNDPFHAEGEKNEETALDDEPKLTVGLGAALKLAQRKGLLDKETTEQYAPGQTVQLLQAKDAVLDHQRFDDIDAKFAKRERHHGPLSSFDEKEGYKPKVRLDYIDEYGRQLSAKEAFRSLSHKFHGRTSGKKKTEKKLKKIQEEIILNTAATSDTPLGTAEKLSKKLEQDRTPFVVLSGRPSSSRTLSK